MGECCSIFFIVESNNSSSCRTDKDADDLTNSQLEQCSAFLYTEVRTVRTGVAVTEKNYLVVIVRESFEFKVYRRFSLFWTFSWLIIMPKRRDYKKWQLNEKSKLKMPRMSRKDLHQPYDFKKKAVKGSTAMNMKKFSVWLEDSNNAFCFL